MTECLRRMSSTITLLAVIIVGGVACTSTDDSTHAAPLQVSTSSGTLHGHTVGATRQFTGVRYAQAPTGDRRWAPPVPVSDPKADVDATGVAPQCPQAATPVPGKPPATQGEDCLYLNVTTPQRIPDGSSLPVMVWWHGGGYVSGSGSSYDAQRLAVAGDVVVVTVNYRLGIFGYLGLPGLAGSGDFGFADQLQSLRWVHDNARAFGGDPGNVTVFGESAGGMSACAALTSPAAKGLIDKAIIESGSCALDFPTGSLFPGVPQSRAYTPLEQSEATGVQVAASLGCAGADTVGCLRDLPVEKLLTQNETFSNGLAYGTALLPTSPATAVADGNTLRIPVITGGNAEENGAFTAGAVTADPHAYTAESYPADLRAAYGDRAQDVAARYPLSSFSSAPAALARVFTDSGWSCPTLRAAHDLSKHATTFTYEFADATGPNVSGGDNPAVPKAAFHADELPYLFDLNGTNLVPHPPQSTLSAAMIEYWTSFAHSGTPTAADQPQWPSVSAASGPVQSFAADGVHGVDFRAEHQCDFWDSVPIT